MHLDGMGTLAAVGGVKDGTKLVTAVEAADAALALRLARFKFYAKPGGSNFVVNDPIDRVAVGDDALQGLKQLWTRHGVRWGTFKIHKGEGYLIAAGIPHEFLNTEGALSIAWNIVPACDEEQEEPIPWILLQRALRDAEADLVGTSGRLAAAIDHAPATVLLRQAFPKLMTTESPVICKECAQRHRNLHSLHVQAPGDAAAALDRVGAGAHACHETSECWDCSLLGKVREKREGRQTPGKGAGGAESNMRKEHGSGVKPLLPPAAGKTSRRRWPVDEQTDLIISGTCEHLETKTAEGVLQACIGSCEVRKSSLVNAGRGLFSTKDLMAGAAVAVLSEGIRTKESRGGCVELKDGTFQEYPDPGRMWEKLQGDLEVEDRNYILGRAGCLANEAPHKELRNAAIVQIRTKDRKLMTLLIMTCGIRPGREILTDYGDGTWPHRKGGLGEWESAGGDGRGGGGEVASGVVWNPQRTASLVAEGGEKKRSRSAFEPGWGQGAGHPAADPISKHEEQTHVQLLADQFVECGAGGVKLKRGVGASSEIQKELVEGLGTCGKLCVNRRFQMDDRGWRSRIALLLFHIKTKGCLPSQREDVYCKLFFLGEP